MVLTENLQEPCELTSQGCLVFVHWDRSLLKTSLKISKSDQGLVDLLESKGTILSSIIKAACVKTNGGAG